MEKDNEIYLYCKGGDTKMKERLADSETNLMKQTDEHLNVCSFQIKHSLVYLFI